LSEQVIIFLETIFFQHLLHFFHLLVHLVDTGLLQLVVLNDVGKIVEAVINGSTLLTGGAIDRVLPSGSLGGLTTTLHT
jgi:hypothetical protein